MNMSSQGKKKIGIITRHAVPNYGSLLQAYATLIMLEDLGYDAEIIDYRRNDEGTSALAKYYIGSTSNIARKIYYALFWRISHWIVNKKFENVRKEKFHLSERVTDCNWSVVTDKYDVLMTGSDQVWNVVGAGNTIQIDDRYFWNGVNENKRVISYAASFGEKTFNEKIKRNISVLLGNFDCISVREYSAVAVIEDMGYKAVQVMDPTIIVRKNLWEQMADRSKIKVKRPYILVYNLHSNSNMQRFVQKETKAKGLAVYSITTTFRKSAGKNIFCPSIDDFLWLFKNAECVYTDSFHAIAFSLIFNSPFFAILPKEYSTRLESVLKTFDLEDRVCDMTLRYIERKEIDWDNINRIIENERGRSLEWLANALA